MTTKTLFVNYATYNLWANSTLVDWLRSKPLELMEREIPSSFPTIKQTLLHMWGAEDIWLQRLKGISVTQFLSERFQGSTTDVFDGLIDVSTEFLAYVEALSDEDFEKQCPFRLLNGTEDSKPRIYMIHHCMNHATYHRGQIVTMARNFGLSDPPSTDYIRYLRMHL